MSNFGFDQLRVVEPYELAFREARSAVGAREVLKTSQQYENVRDAVEDSKLVVGTSAIGNRLVEQPIRTLEAGAKFIRNHLRSGRVAILFGSEKTGLSNEDLSHCHWLLHIPTLPGHLSMNLGQAVAVTLYELMRQNPPAKSKPNPNLATAGDLERLTQLLLEAATISGFLSAQSLDSGEQKLRRLMRRLHPQAEDGEVLLGILRQILWKLHPERG
jgi:tRNA/rRNA methyltransferase